ncbi:MAG: alpha/beta hydrolase [Mobilicoccus sp.]|nr:alpha/beta hydrolase [Mobilicoccus sp.]
MQLSTWIRAVDGVILGGLENDGDGPDVLLVHTAGLSAMTWAPVMEHLPHLHCVALDLRGHSLSVDAPVEDADVNWRDLIRLTEAHDLVRPLLVGVNSGAFMALAAAAERPDLFRAVVGLEAGLPHAPRHVVHDDLSLIYSDDFMDDLCERFGFGEVVDNEAEIELAAAATAAGAGIDWMLEEVDETIAEETRYSFVRRGDAFLHTPDRATLRTLYTISLDAPYFPSAEMYDAVDVPLHLIQARDGLNTLTDAQIAVLTARRDVTVHRIEGGPLAHRSHPVEVADIICDVVGAPRPPSGSGGDVEQGE